MKSVFVAAAWLFLGVSAAWAQEDQMITVMGAGSQPSAQGSTDISPAPRAWTRLSRGRRRRASAVRP